MGGVKGPEILRLDFRYGLSLAIAVKLELVDFEAKKKIENFSFSI